MSIALWAQFFAYYSPANDADSRMKRHLVAPAVISSSKIDVQLGGSRGHVVSLVGISMIRAGIWTLENPLHELCGSSIVLIAVPVVTALAFRELLNTPEFEIYSIGITFLDLVTFHGLTPILTAARCCLNENLAKTATNASLRSSFTPASSYWMAPSRDRSKKASSGISVGRGRAHRSGSRSPS